MKLGMQFTFVLWLRQGFRSFSRISASSLVLVHDMSFIRVHTIVKPSAFVLNSVHHADFTQIEL